jgi:hypothetical protein
VGGRRLVRRGAGGPHDGGRLPNEPIAVAPCSGTPCDNAPPLYDGNPDDRDDRASKPTPRYRDEGTTYDAGRPAEPSSDDVPSADGSRCAGAVRPRVAALPGDHEGRLREVELRGPLPRLLGNRF